MPPGLCPAIDGARGGAAPWGWKPLLQLGLGRPLAFMGTRAVGWAGLVALLVPYCNVGGTLLIGAVVATLGGIAVARPGCRSFVAAAPGARSTGMALLNPYPGLGSCAPDGSAGGVRPRPHGLAAAGCGANSQQMNLAGQRRPERRAGARTGRPNSVEGPATTAYRKPSLALFTFSHQRHLPRQRRRSRQAGYDPGRQAT